MTPEFARLVCDRIRNERLLSIEAALNPEFRASLRADPRSAVAYLLNDHLPEDLEIELVEMDSKRLRITLPPRTALENELSEAELDQMAGGSGYSGLTTQYLTLQQQMTNESSLFSALSNILKSQQDTTQSIVSNIK